MLVLSRRMNEEILFPGMNISVKVLAVSPGSKVSFLESAGPARSKHHPGRTAQSRGRMGCCRGNSRRQLA